MEDEYILDTLLPTGEIHILGGASEAGKTTLLYQFIDRWRRGLPILGFASRPTSYCYIGGDRRSNAYERLEERLGIEPINSINVVDVTRAAERIPEITLDWLSRQLEYFHDPETLFLDPLDLFAGISNFNDKHQVAKGMLKLGHWLGERTGVCMLHTAKQRENNRFLDVFDAISGSHSLQAYCSTRAMLVRNDRDHEKKPCLYIRGQNFPEHQITLTIEGNGAFGIEQVHSDWNTAAALLVRFPAGPVETGSLVALLEEDGTASRRSVYRALTVLEHRRQIHKVSHGMWERRGEYPRSVK